eukprot:366381-Chlamydomonas_euryale.AAC.4
MQRRGTMATCMSCCNIIIGLVDHPLPLGPSRTRCSETGLSAVFTRFALSKTAVGGSGWRWGLGAAWCGAASEQSWAAVEPLLECRYRMECV